MARQRFKFDASVFAIVRKDAKILALRRAGTGWLDGYWSLPAGAYEGSETFAEAALRELSEEIGFVGNARSTRLAHVQQVFMPDTEWLASYFEIDEPGGTPSIMEPDKNDRLAWLDGRNRGGQRRLWAKFCRTAADTGMSALGSLRTLRSQGAMIHNSMQLPFRPRATAL